MAIAPASAGTRIAEARPGSDPYDDPRAAIAIDLFRLLMAGGEEAVFRGREPGEAESPYRVTAWWETGERIYPMLRMRYGRAPKLCASRLYFLRGEPYAGRLWGDPDLVLVEGALPSLAGAGDDPGAWRAAWEKLGVPRLVTESLGDETPYAKIVRTLVGFSVRTAYGPIVFCIDSPRMDACGPSFLAHPDAGPSRDLGWLLRFLVERTSMNRDFWTWTFSRSWSLSVFVLGWLPALSAAGLMTASAVTTFLSPTLDPLPPTPSWVSPAGSLVLALNLLAISATSWRRAPHVSLRRGVPEGREQLLHSFGHALSAWGASLVALAAAQLLAPPLADAALCLKALFGFAALLSLLRSYHALALFNPKRAPQPPRFRIAAAIAAILDVCLLTMAPPDSPLRYGTFVGLATSVVGALLVGRLESRLFPTPALVIGLMYGGVVLQAAQAVLPPNGLFDLLRVPSSTALVLVVSWIAQTGGIERYLENLETLSAWSPRIGAGIGIRGAARIVKRRP